MGNELIHDRGRGPEIVGTRITVYNLLPHLLDPTITEGQVCDMYDLSPKQVAAVRAYVLAHFEDVIRHHKRFEQALQQENSPQVIEQTRAVRSKLKSFREWLAEKKAAEVARPSADGASAHVQSFSDWLCAREAEHAGAVREGVK